MSLKIRFEGCVVVNMITIFRMSCLNTGVFSEEITSSFVVTKLFLSFASASPFMVSKKSMVFLQFHTYLVCLSCLLLPHDFDYFCLLNSYIFLFFYTMCHDLSAVLSVSHPTDLSCPPSFIGVYSASFVVVVVHPV